MIFRIFLFFLITFSGSPAWAVDRHVPADFQSIQAALDVAVDGDRVVVAPGRYYEALRIPARRIHLIASAGPTLTTIDAQQLGTVVTFEGAPGRGTILEGFTLTNGLDPGMNKAGGVHIGEGASPVVRGNVIRQNLGYGIGHGISLFRPASPLIERNEIRHNRSGPGVTGGGGGGGIGIHDSVCSAAPACAVEIRNNYIGNNYVTAFSSGGGIFLNGARAIITGNVIEYNTVSNSGGGLSSSNGSPARIENNLFYANLAIDYGGGIDSSVAYGDMGPIIINNTFVANEAAVGSAINTGGYDGQSRIANNVISAIGNGSALYCAPGHDSAAPLTRHNLVYAPSGSAYAGLCADMSGSNGNQSAEPAFMGETDFRLQPDSPGVDEGENSQSSQSTDLAGKARIADGNGDGLAVIDVGAYELPSPMIFADGFEANP